MPNTEIAVPVLYLDIDGTVRHGKDELGRFVKRYRLVRDDVPALNWVVVGGESGPRARPMHPDWARQLRDQCQSADVPFLFKQHGEWVPLGPLYDQHDDEQEADDARHEAAYLEAVEGRQVIQLETSGSVADEYQPGDHRTWLMARLGRRVADRALDGRIWDDYPQGAADGAR